MFCMFGEASSACALGGRTRSSPSAGFFFFFFLCFPSGCEVKRRRLAEQALSPHHVEVELLVSGLATMAAAIPAGVHGAMRECRVESSRVSRWE